MFFLTDQTFVWRTKSLDFKEGEEEGQSIGRDPKIVGKGAKGGAEKPQGVLVRGYQVIKPSGWVTSQARTGVKLDERSTGGRGTGSTVGVETSCRD